MLPKKMSGKSDDEIQKAVFQAYETKLKVISEYSAHVLDPASPYGFFKDEMPISNARTSNPQSDLIFYNNAIRGFIGQNKNSITIKWAPNQVIYSWLLNLSVGKIDHVYPMLESKMHSNINLGDP